MLLGIASFPSPRVARVPNKFRPGVARGSAIEGDDGGGLIARVKWICHDKHKNRMSEDVYSKKMSLQN